MTASLYPAEFLKRIPKTDLHCHLDGSVRLDTLIDLAKAQGVHLPAYDVPGLKKLVFKESYANLVEYLECFQYTSDVLRNAAALERVAYELAVDQFEIGVRYFEVRFAPQLNAVPGELSIEEVLVAVNKGLQRAIAEFNAHPLVMCGEEPEYDVGIIVCAMRFFTKESSPWYNNFWEMHADESAKRIYGLASMALVSAVGKVRNTLNIPIVAIDVAGAENGFPNGDHKEAFALAHKKFFFKTVHAGESYGPESIFQAITDCHAERIGHGFHIFDAEHFSEPKGLLATREDYISRLAQYMASMRICLEVCISSNLQTIPTATLKSHPIKKMLEAKMAVTLCSDNTTVSSTDVLKELNLAIDAFHLTPQQVKDITMTGFKRSFMPKDYVAKRAYNRRVIDFYERLEKEYGIPDVGRKNSLDALRND
ncbi:hypothetical protein HDU98_005451 [Podochytrium sp. JEL0797]|nr:hypothetical protein HDU98_005451 [Podochytrium sp. JEL0797]